MIKYPVILTPFSTDSDMFFVWDGNVKIVGQIGMKEHPELCHELIAYLNKRYSHKPPKKTLKQLFWEWWERNICGPAPDWAEGN